MTAPDKVWIADPYLSAVDGSIQAGTYSPCSDWHFKHEYTRTDLSNALIAAAFEAAAKFCEDNEVGTSTRLCYVVSPFYRDETSGKHPGMACGDPIRAITPPDAQAALQAMIDAAVKDGAADSFAMLIADARAEASKAMKKFPQPNYVISKFAEEAGEVVKAAIHCAENRETPENVRGEMKQAIAMLYRLWVEGDQVHGLAPLANIGGAA